MMSVRSAVFTSRALQSNKFRAAFVFGLALAAMARPALAEVKLASIFGENMVIQRDRPTHIWGTAKPNSTVSVQFGSKKTQGKADATGKWSAVVAPQPAGGPFTLEATDGTSPVSLKEVYLGDVWLCSGQSNMQMSTQEADNGKATAAKAAQHTTLRLCKIGQAWTDKPQTDCKAEWKTAGEESALRFSAVGYFFGDALLRSPELKGVPIGLIEADLGGTLAEAWTPKEELSTIQGKAENSMFGIAPTTLYNGMIAPLGKTGIKGVVWYQGEGNAGDPASYPSKLTAMIRGWRKQFQNPKLPFLIVQLPDFASAWGDYYWQWIRDAQRQVADKVPDVGLVTAINTNDGLDLHPKPKQAIGQRAALLARQDVYGEKIPGHGPQFKAADVSADGIRVTFDTVGSKLAAADPNDVRGFMLAGADGKFRMANARIEGEAVVLKSEFIRSPKFVRYAWAGVPNATLTNTDGLPAYPFRTDTLPMDSVGTQPLAGGNVLGAKGSEITVQSERVTSFTVKGKQFLSNETGINSGVVVPGFLGPAGLGAYSELGPDFIQLGGEKNNVQISLDSKGSTWNFHNDENDGRTIRFNLSPTVKTSDLNNGTVTLTRPGASMKVSGVEKIEAGDGLPFLQFKVEPHSNTTVKFEFGE